MWKQSILTVADDLDFSELNLDGSHAIAKKGGESVTYQPRKRAKTSNILPICRTPPDTRCLLAELSCS